jgi:hypothetical protein
MPDTLYCLLLISARLLRGAPFEERPPLDKSIGMVMDMARFVNTNYYYLLQISTFTTKKTSDPSFMKRDRKVCASQYVVMLSKYLIHSQSWKVGLYIQECVCQPGNKKINYY